MCSLSSLLEQQIKWIAHLIFHIWTNFKGQWIKYFISIIFCVLHAEFLCLRCFLIGDLMFRFKYYRFTNWFIGNWRNWFNATIAINISQPFNTVENYRLCFRLIWLLRASLRVKTLSHTSQVYPGFWCTEFSWRLSIDFRAKLAPHSSQAKSLLPCLLFTWIFNCRSMANVLGQNLHFNPRICSWTLFTWSARLCL